MVKITQQKDKELHQCKECGFKYAEKEWAEKCEAWCKEHQSCNIEITAHAVQESGATSEDKTPEKSLSADDIKFLTKLFYGLVGLSASLAFFLTLYLSLRINSSIASLIGNTYDKPLYFWPYVILTFAAIILFGINASFFVYRWRKFGPPKLKKQAGTGFGSIAGVAASACPICGSTILAAIGIAGGLAAFPLGGLELKALSLGLLILPLWLTTKDLKDLQLKCEVGACPPPRDASFKEGDKPLLLIALLLVLILGLTSWNMLKSDPAIAKLLTTQRGTITNPKGNQLFSTSTPQTGNRLFDEIIAKVLPPQGFQSKIYLGDSIAKLVRNGVIDRQKLEAIYQNRNGIPPALKSILSHPSAQPILLTRENANIYVNLLWPLGLSNYMSTNEESPIKGKSLFNFASTGGWNLGKEENGGAYFNKFKIVELTPPQEALVTKIAQNTYRPCCNNSTFFQDCNHGSALLGLLELGASQGLTEDELWREALVFNSFWFPDTYIKTALYFKAAKNIDWEDVDPKMVMGKDFSSISGWSTNVEENLKALGLLPQVQGGGGCGV